MKPFVICLLLLGLLGSAYPPAQAQTLAAERQQMLEAASQQLSTHYALPEVATRLARQVRANQRRYAAIQDGRELASQLTAVLYAIAHDKHLNIGYHPEGVSADQVWTAESAAEQRAGQLAAMREGVKRENFGILDLWVLRYTTGCPNLKYLVNPEVAGESYVAALNYLARTDALILDLRQCDGATSEYVIPLLCSYFFAECG